MEKRMRILHTADWHLGRKTDDLDRLEEQRNILKQITKIARDEAVDMVIIAGDIYEQFIPSADAENLFYQTISELSNNGDCAVVAIAGNHDEPKRMSNAQVFASRFGIYLVGYYDEIPMNPLNKDKNIFATEVGKGYIKFETKTGEKCTVACLPYPSFYRYKCTKIEDQTLPEKFREWLGEATSKFMQGENNILVSHLQTIGASVKTTNHNDYYSEYTPFTAINKDVLANCGASYVALGHLHHNIVVDDEAHIYYPGSIINTHFIESYDTDNGVYVAEIVGGKVKNVDFKKINCKKLTFVSAKSLDEVDAFCKSHVDDYIKAIIDGVKYVDFEDVKKIKADNPNLVTLGVITEEAKELANVETKKDLTTGEIFDKYCLSKTGEMPDAKVKELFLELMGESVYETN